MIQKTLGTKEPKTLFSRFVPFRIIIIIIYFLFYIKGCVKIYFGQEQMERSIKYPFTHKCSRQRIFHFLFCIRKHTNFYLRMRKNSFKMFWCADTEKSTDSTEFRECLFSRSFLTIWMLNCMSLPIYLYNVQYVPTPSYSLTSHCKKNQKRSAV